MKDALTLDPNNPNFLNNIGTCFYMLHEYSKLKDILKGLEIDKNTFILNNLGNLKTYKIEESIEYYEKGKYSKRCSSFFNLVGIYRITNRKRIQKVL